MQEDFKEEFASIRLLALQIKDGITENLPMTAGAICIWTDRLEKKMNDYHIIKKCRCCCDEEEYV